jgi:hypothetical protein
MASDDVVDADALPTGNPYLPPNLSGVPPNHICLLGKGERERLSFVHDIDLEDLHCLKPLPGNKWELQMETIPKEQFNKLTAKKYRAEFIQKCSIVTAPALKTAVHRFQCLYNDGFNLPASLVVDDDDDDDDDDINEDDDDLAVSANELESCVQTKQQINFNPWKPSI